MQKNAKSKNPRVKKTNKRRMMTSSKCALYDSKKSSGLFNKLRVRVPLSNLHMLGNVLL